MSAVAPVSWWLLQLPKENGTVSNDTIRFQIGSDSLDQDVILRPMDDRGHQLVRIRKRAMMIHAEGLRRKIRKGLDALSMDSEACFLLADKEHLSCAFTFFEEPSHLPFPSSSSLAPLFGRRLSLKTTAQDPALLSQTSPYANESVSARQCCDPGAEFLNSEQPFLTGLSVRFTVGYSTLWSYALDAH